MTGCVPAMTRLLFAMVSAEYTGCLQAIIKPDGLSVFVHCHLTMGRLGVPMAIDRPMGRLILVEQYYCQ